MSALVVSAPAKVNLYLAVGRKRPDGYHDLVTVMQSLTLADEVVVRPAEELHLACEPDPCAVPEANIAYRAAVDLTSAFGVDPHLAIRITKRIPSGAGLGGGSADAAAVLVGICRLLALPLDSPEVRAVAAGLGADVPFALLGGTALLEGRGDRLVRTLVSPPLHLVLINPGDPVSTADAYAAFDDCPVSSPPSPDTLLDALEGGDVAGVADSLYNNMTHASSMLVGTISDALAFLHDIDGILGSAMAGSGSTVFGVCRDASIAQAAADRARERGWWATATTTAAAGPRVIGEMP